MCAKCVGDIMIKKVITVTPQQTIGDVVLLMGDYGIRHLIVTDKDGQAVGLVSQRDVFKELARVFRHKERPSEVPVARFMTSELVYAHPDTPVHRASEMMAARKIGCLPVISKDGLVGIVTTVDLLRQVAPGNSSELQESADV